MKLNRSFERSFPFFVYNIFCSKRIVTHG